MELWGGSDHFQLLGLRRILTDTLVSKFDFTDMGWLPHLSPGYFSQGSWHTEKVSSLLKVT